MVSHELAVLSHPVEGAAECQNLCPPTRSRAKINDHPHPSNIMLSVRRVKEIYIGLVEREVTRDEICIHALYHNLTEL